VTLTIASESAARWASPVIDSDAGSILHAARAHGPVRLIATPWSVVATRPAANSAAVESDDALQDFDQIPLTAPDGARVTAVYVRGAGVVPLDTGMFMAADAPLLAFVESADQQRFRLLVDGGELVGLVTLSDLQRLPVYSLLFGLVIAVESLLVEWIRIRCRQAPDAWLEQLSRTDREQIERYYERSKSQNIAIDRLSCASFTQEVRAAVGLGLMRDNDLHHRCALALIDLRNDVCHAKEFAATPALALDVPRRAREASALAHWLQNAVQSQQQP
jgi:hypothetical protein